MGCTWSPCTVDCSCSSIGDLITSASPTHHTSWAQSHVIDCNFPRSVVGLSPGLLPLGLVLVGVHDGWRDCAVDGSHLVKAQESENDSDWNLTCVFSSLNEKQHRQAHHTTWGPWATWAYSGTCTRLKCAGLRCQSRCPSHGPLDEALGALRGLSPSLESCDPMGWTAPTASDPHALQ